MSENERPSASLIERIHKILSKTTEAGCTQQEADAAFAMASRLMAEHNLKMDDVRVSGGGESAEEKFVEEPAYQTGRWTLECNLAYNIVKTYFFVEGFLGGRVGNQKVLYFFGTEANTATAKHIFNALLSSADRLWTTYRITRNRPASESRLYKTGLMSGFREKLDEERRALKMEQDILRGSSGGTELAIKRVEEMTTQKFKEAHSDLKNKSRSYAAPSGDRSTLQAGYEAGRSLNLNRGIGGSNRKGIS